jgi:hypothetical protein
MVSVKVENQTSGTLYLYQVATVAAGKAGATVVTVAKDLGTVSSNKTRSVDATESTLLLIAGAKADKSATLQSQDLLFEVGTSGGTVLVGSGTALTKALMWVFFVLMILLIIVVIVLLVIHFHRNHQQAKVAASVADSLVNTANGTASHPVATPAKAYVGGQEHAT